MVRVFLVNKRREPSDPRLFAATEYSYAGNTKILPPNSRTEVSEDEAQVATARFGTVGVSIERERS